MRQILTVLVLAFGLAACALDDIVGVDFKRITFANAWPRAIQIVNERGEPYELRLDGGTVTTTIQPGAVGQTTQQLEVQNRCVATRIDYTYPCWQRSVTVAWAREVYASPTGQVLSTPCTLAVEEGKLTAFQIRGENYGRSGEGKMICEEIIGGGPLW